MALTEDLSEHSLVSGQVGKVVESLDEGVFEIEFSENEGRAYASLALRADQVMVLHEHRAA